MVPLRGTGFTLVELMIVLAIVGILTMLAAPAFGPIIESQRAKAAASDLYIALTRARSEATKRNVDIRILPNSGSADWKPGWKIVDPSDVLIDDHGALGGTLAVEGPADVTYRPSGRVRGAAPEFELSGNHAASARCVSADLSGRPHVKSGAC